MSDDVTKTDVATPAASVAAQTTTTSTAAQTPAAGPATSSATQAESATTQPLTPLQQLSAHLSSSMHHLWTSALIVEQGVAQGAHATIGDESLERMMGLAQPKMTIQDVSNQNLQKQVDGYLQSLIAIDRVSREIPLTVPKSVIECVESGHNPSLISQRHIEETKFKHESVRAKVFATKVLHDQLKLRTDLWDEMLSKEAAAGMEQSKLLLQTNLDTLRSHHLP